jgi:hypothetical protein
MPATGFELSSQAMLSILRQFKKLRPDLGEKQSPR